MKKHTDRYFGLSPRIAKWKFDTPFENWLSYKADNSELCKRIYVLYYRILDGAYYKEGVKRIRSIIDIHRNQWGDFNDAKVTRDMIYCLHRFGISFQDYCIYGFIDKNLHSRRGFIADKLRYHYCDILNDKSISDIMTDKYACFQHYKDFYKREVIGCNEEKDFSQFSSFLLAHDKFIFKPMSDHSGHGIKIILSSEINAESFFSDSLKKGPFIVEELIVQGVELAEMHRECINTLRVVTFVDGSDVKIVGVTWRIGVGAAVMDNAGAGGIYASVDPVTGVVQTCARNYKGDRYLFHPDSGKQIIGFKLPRWEEALKMINEIATFKQGTTLISWDIAYSSKGWCMVEANENGDWSIIQSNRMEGKKDELYLMMDSYFKNKNYEHIHAKRKRTHLC